MKKTKKRLKMSKFERLLYVFTIFLCLVTPLAIIFSQATLSQINFEVEKVKEEIEKQEKQNESLSMKINELASLEKIQEVAKEQGLTFDNNNIKNIEK